MMSLVVSLVVAVCSCSLLFGVFSSLRVSRVEKERDMLRQEEAVLKTALKNHKVRLENEESVDGDREHIISRLQQSEDLRD